METENLTKRRKEEEGREREVRRTARRNRRPGADSGNGRKAVRKEGERRGSRGREGEKEEGKRWQEGGGRYREEGST